MLKSFESVFLTCVDSHQHQLIIHHCTPPKATCHQRLGFCRHVLLDVLLLPCSYILGCGSRGAPDGPSPRSFWPAAVLGCRPVRLLRGVPGWSARVFLALRSPWREILPELHGEKNLRHLSIHLYSDFKLHLTNVSLRYKLQITSIIKRSPNYYCNLSSRLIVGPVGDWCWPWQAPVCHRQCSQWSLTVHCWWFTRPNQLWGWRNGYDTPVSKCDVK